MRTYAFLAGAFALLNATAAISEEFQTISDRQSFLALVNGKQLTRLGIKLDVLSSGQIEGRAFGKPVKGQWDWKNGHFCRDLHFGDTDLGPNCQVVKANGRTLRFIADQGRGDHADLRLN
jgi:hypothetical protein